jgi:hypothetical protein
LSLIGGLCSLQILVTGYSFGHPMYVVRSDVDSSFQFSTFTVT